MQKNQKKKVPSKGRVKNATPNEYDGIKFRSKLETYTYKKLKEAKINADYEQHRFQLLPAFQYGNKKYRPMTYLPDFVGILSQNVRAFLMRLGLYVRNYLTIFCTKIILI